MFHLPLQRDEWTLVEHTFVVPESTVRDDNDEIIPIKNAWVHFRLENAIGASLFTQVELVEIADDK